MPKRRTHPQSLFLLVGGLLLVVSYFVTPKDKLAEFWTSTIQNIALIALTVVIIDWLWNIVGGDPAQESAQRLQDMLEELRQSTKLLDDSHNTGLRRVFSASGAFGSTEDWMARLACARSCIDLMGYTLHILTRGRDFERTVGELVRNGVRIRVLVMSPKNPELSALINYHQIHGLTLPAVTEELKAAIAAFGSLKRSLNSDDFEVHVMEVGLIVTQLFRVDSKLTSIQYLYSAVASRSPILEVHGSDTDLFKCYSDEFEQCWALSTPAV